MYLLFNYIFYHNTLTACSKNIEKDGTKYLA